MVLKLLVISILLLQGCGYHLRGFGDTLPSDVKTVAILPFDNKTFEADMATLLESSLAKEFSRVKRLSVVPEDQADALLTGSISSFENRPVSFSSADQVRDYRVEVTVDVRLKYRQREEILWTGKGLREVKDYKVEPGNEDLAEINKNEAKETVADELAELIVDRIFEGF
ncbi:MAG: hypothetical protein IME96_13285 [Proteobacteria bacterium]|nr:hypothetical protein [Pseudomonadota bacterium]